MHLLSEIDWFTISTFENELKNKTNEKEIKHKIQMNQIISHAMIANITLDFFKIESNVKIMQVSNVFIKLI